MDKNILLIQSRPLNPWDPKFDVRKNLQNLDENMRRWIHEEIIFFIKNKKPDFIIYFIEDVFKPGALIS